MTARRLSHLILAALILASCADQIPESTLPEGAATLEYTYVTKSFLRGVRGSYNTIPAGRPADLLNVTYTMSCLDDGGRSAARRFETAKTVVDRNYRVAPLYFDNPRERGWWASGAREKIRQETECHLIGVKVEKTRSSLGEALIWLQRNNVAS